MAHRPESRARVIYIPHGGGPMPLLGDPGHANLIRFLTEFPGELGRPEAILVVSAHWEASHPSLTAGSMPELIYDYGGFPPESYEISYPAPGAPALATEIAQLLQENGWQAILDQERGFDHGMFVPLKLVYPQADIPCIQLSLLRSLDAAQHIKLGRVLAPLLGKNLLVIGSGMSFHNLQSFFMPHPTIDTDNEEFESWLHGACTREMPEAKRAELLSNWHKAPGGLSCHPRPEHLLPLHVCYGMVQGKAERIFNKEVMGKHVSGYLWESPSK